MCRRLTVNVAYERLPGEGFVISRQGAGTFVSELTARPPAKQRSRGAIEPRPIGEAIELTSVFGAEPLQVRQ
jgi:GntR family transcriptional regulator / MocR family aminotransferase